MPFISSVRGSFGAQGKIKIRPFVGSGGTLSVQNIGGIFYNVHTFDYSGSNQTFTVLDKGTTTKVIAKVWGAAGGAGTSYWSTFGGPGGYGTATINTNTLGSSFTVVVGQGGRTSAGERSTYGHVNLSTDGRPGGFGASCGDGGGLSGIFNGTSTHANSILIAGGGGGSVMQQEVVLYVGDTHIPLQTGQKAVVEDLDTMAEDLELMSLTEDIGVLQVEDLDMPIQVFVQI